MIEAVDDALLQARTLTHAVVDPQLAQRLNGSNSTVVKVDTATRA